MRIPIFELSFVDKISRYKNSIAFCPGECGDIISDGAVVDDAVGIDDECFLWVDVVIVDVRTDDDGSSGNLNVLYIEETFANGAIPCNVSK